MKFGFIPSARSVFVDLRLRVCLCMFCEVFTFRADGLLLMHWAGCGSWCDVFGFCFGLVWDLVLVFALTCTCYCVSSVNCFGVG